MDKIVQVGYNWIQDQHMMEAILAAGHIKNTQVLGQIGQWNRNKLANPQGHIKIVKVAKGP